MLVDYLPYPYHSQIVVQMEVTNLGLETYLHYFTIEKLVFL